MSRACGYVPSIGVGHRRFYLVETQPRIHMVFWYALHKDHAYNGALTRHLLDIRTLPAAYLEGLEIDLLSRPLSQLRGAHRAALKRAIADNFDFAAHCLAEEAREVAAEEARIRSAPTRCDDDDDIPF